MNAKIYVNTSKWTEDEKLILKSQVAKLNSEELQIEEVNELIKDSIAKEITHILYIDVPFYTLDILNKFKENVKAKTKSYSFITSLNLRIFVNRIVNGVFFSRKDFIDNFELITNSKYAVSKNDLEFIDEAILKVTRKN